MEKITLEAKKRIERGKKTKKGKSEGMIPAVVYGKGVESESLWVKSLDFKRLLKKSGESTLIDLDIDGKDNRNVIIYGTQKDPVSDVYTHIDFFQVKMDEKIKTEVELVFVGESPAVKESGGVLVKNLDKIEVECLPADLPSSIEVDISSIKTFDNYIYVKNLKIGKGVEIKLEPETVVALVSPPRTDEELAGLEEKVEADVTKVEGVVKPDQAGEEMAKEPEDKKAEGKKAGEKKGK
ncbi:MAG TPA: 50S ribosomal protein L25 [Patescibacteria group bacterium]